jgi:hypothetical protein
MTLSRVNDGLQEQHNEDDLQMATSLTSCSVSFLFFPLQLKNGKPKDILSW